MDNLPDHPHSVYLLKEISRAEDKAVPVQLFLLGAPPLSGVVCKTDVPGVFKMIAMGVSIGQAPPPGEVPPPITVTFTPDQIVAIMWPEEEVLREESRIIS